MEVNNTFRGRKEIIPRYLIKGFPFAGIYVIVLVVKGLVFRGIELLKEESGMEILVNEYLEYLRDKKKVSDNTFSSYRRDLKKLVQYLIEQDILDLTKVTSDTIQEYLTYLKESNYAIATITRNFIAVKSLFRFLYNGGYIEQNPSEWIQLPKVQSNPNTVLTKGEMEALLQQSTGVSFKGLRDKAMLLLLYDTKISISELVNLKVENINFDHSRIDIVSGENGRNYPFHEKTHNALEEHIQYSSLKKTDWLFPNRYGNPMSRQGFWKTVKNYAKEANIEKEITLYSIKQGEV